MNISNPPVRIRVAEEADSSALADMNLRLASETENRRLDRTTVEAGVRNGLQRHPEVLYLLAIADDGRPVGQLMLTREWSDWRNGWAAWIQSVYVMSEYRGQGVFRALLQFAESHLKQAGDYVLVRLYVENDNQRAQDVYRRSGFEDPHYRVLEKRLT